MPDFAASEPDLPAAALPAAFGAGLTGLFLSALRAVAGGAILGGMFGNAITRDMPCEDHPYAFRVYAEGLDGEIGHRYEWHHGDDYGYFVPQSEFRRDGDTCRSFTETTYRGGRSFSHSGTACRAGDADVYRNPEKTRGSIAGLPASGRGSSAR